MVDLVGNYCEMMDLDRRGDRSRCPLASICPDVLSGCTEYDYGGGERCRRDGWLTFRGADSPSIAASLVSLWQSRCQGSEGSESEWHSASFQGWIRHTHITYPSFLFLSFSFSSSLTLSLFLYSYTF